MAWSYKEHTCLSFIKTLVVYSQEFLYSQNFIILSVESTDKNSSDLNCIYEYGIQYHSPGDKKKHF